MVTKKRTWMIAATVVALAVLAGCAGCRWNVDYTFQPPEDIGDGFEIGTIDEANLDSRLLGVAVEWIRAGRYGEVHALLVYSNNRLVVEEYFAGHVYRWDGPGFHGPLVSWERSMPHVCQSVAKSITSVCIGIAADQGFIESVEQSIFDYLPDHQHLAVDGKDQITIEHLLTMTSGLEWDQESMSYGNTANDAVGILSGIPVWAAWNHFL